MQYLQLNMKQLVFIVTIFLPIVSLSQHALLSTDNTRVLYVNLENKISISVPGYSCEELQLRADSVMMEGDGCNYIVTVKRPYIAYRKWNNINFIISSKKTHRAIDTVSIPLRYFPDPIMKIAYGKKVNDSLFIEGPVLIGADGSYIESLFRLVEFEVTIVRGDGEILSQHKNIGSYYDATVISFFKKAKSGDKLFIEEVKAIGPDNKQRKLNSIMHIFP